MTEVGTAWVKVRPKTDTFDQELQSSVIGPLKHVAEIAGITFGLDKAAGFFGDAIQGAVQLDQAQRRVNFAFGDGADSVIKFGETAAQKIGASAKAADIANASFGNMFKSAGLEDGKQIADMSTTLTQRAADLAAATGHDLPTAQNAFQMAMLGSTRSLREFGIRMTPQELPLEALKLGLIEPTVNADKLRAATDNVTKAQDALNVAIKKHGANSDEAKIATDKLTNAQDALGKIADGSLPKLNDEQTALAAYQLILDKTSASSGYYAANTDSAAEKQQALTARWDDAKDKLGAGLLPVAERFTDWATNAIPTVEKVFDAFGPAASRDIGIIGDDLGTIANVVGPPLKDVLSFAGDHMGIIRDAAAVLVGIKVADWAHGVLGGFKSIEGDGVFGRLETKFKSVFLPTFSAGDKAKVTAECEGMCASCKCAPGIGGPGGGGGAPGGGGTAPRENVPADRPPPDPARPSIPTPVVVGGAGAAGATAARSTGLRALLGDVGSAALEGLGPAGFVLALDSLAGGGSQGMPSPSNNPLLALFDNPLGALRGAPGRVADAAGSVSITPYTSPGQALSTNPLAQGLRAIGFPGQGNNDATVDELHDLAQGKGVPRLGIPPTGPPASGSGPVGGGQGLPAPWLAAAMTLPQLQSQRAQAFATEQRDPSVQHSDEIAYWDRLIGVQRQSETVQSNISKFTHGRADDVHDEGRALETTSGLLDHHAETSSRIDGVLVHQGAQYDAHADTLGTIDGKMHNIASGSELHRTHLQDINTDTQHVVGTTEQVAGAMTQSSGGADLFHRHLQDVNEVSMPGVLGGAAKFLAHIQDTEGALDGVRGKVKDLGSPLVWADVDKAAQGLEDNVNGIVSAIGKAIAALAGTPRPPNSPTPANINKGDVIIHGPVSVSANTGSDLHQQLTQAAGAAGTRS